VSPNSQPATRNSQQALLNSQPATRNSQQALSFCYPFRFPEGQNRFVKTLEELLRKAGYRNGATSKIGTVNGAVNVLSLARIPASSADDAAMLRAKILGQYDWVGGVQHAKKVVVRGSKRQ
jgi:hypothetical protein